MKYVYLIFVVIIILISGCITEKNGDKYELKVGECDTHCIEKNEAGDCNILNFCVTDAILTDVIRVNTSDETRVIDASEDMSFLWVYFTINKTSSCFGSYCATNFGGTIVGVEYDNNIYEHWDGSGISDSSNVFIRVFESLSLPYANILGPKPGISSPFMLFISFFTEAESYLIFEVPKDIELDKSKFVIKFRDHNYPETEDDYFFYVYSNWTLA